MSINRIDYRSERTQLVDECFRTLSVTKPVCSVLDIACREGLWLGHIQKDYPLAELTGVDIDPQCIKRARRAVSGITYVCADSLMHLNSSCIQYDVILCMGFLYYYYDFESVLALLAKRSNLGILIDTFCLRELDSSAVEIQEVENTPNRMTRRATEAKKLVRIPSYGALCSILLRNGLEIERTDSYSGCYDAGVGKRLGVPLQRVGILARHE